MAPSDLMFVGDPIEAGIFNTRCTIYTAGDLWFGQNEVPGFAFAKVVMVVSLLQYIRGVVLLLLPWAGWHPLT